MASGTQRVLYRYGEISVNNNAVVTTINTVNVFEQITVFDTDGLKRFLTPDHTNDHITVDVTGIYRVEASVSLTTSAGNKTLQFKIRKNNGTTDFNNTLSERKMGTAGDMGHTSSTGLITLNAGDTVELWVANISDSSNVTIRHAVLCAECIDQT